jgi:Mg-chelatase subunit ChlD
LTFQSPWALLLLTVLLPLCLAHLRHPPRLNVPSTLLWRELGVPARPRPARIARPALPLLLLLQVLAITAAVAALAEPASARGPSGPARAQVYVLDAGQGMTATDVAPDRMAAARRGAANLIRRAPAGTLITVVAATARPRVLVSATAAGPASREQALRAVAALAPGKSPADMATALRLAAWQAAGPGRVTVTVIRARGDPLPAVSDPGHELNVITVGRHDEDQAVTRPPARCQPPPRCVVIARALPKQTRVTIVGAGVGTGVLARAFGAMPGVTVGVLAPSRYRSVRSAGQGLLVLDGWLPGGHIPPAQAVLVVDPPARPGEATLTDPVLSGTDDTSPLLYGADLTSLSVPVSATVRTTLPPWIAPVAWTPSGPLLGAGTSGTGTSGTGRVAVFAFDPARSNLPRLAAFPILLQNVLRWATGGTDVPAAPATAQPVRFAASPRPYGPAPLLPWWRWCIAAALLAIAAEALYARRRGRVALGTRLTAFALLSVALAAPGLTRPGGGAPLLLVDQSGSVAGSSRAAEDGWLNSIPHAEAPVTFGTGADTDITQALKLGGAVVNPGSATRLVLVSDGLATSPGTLAAARAARLVVDVAPLPPDAPDAAVTRLAVPEAVRATDTISLQVTVRTTVARTATVTIWRDGHAVSRQAVRLNAGDNPLLISSPSGPPGWRRFRVTVAMPGDAVGRNDALDAVTRVTTPPRLLYVGSDSALLAMLRRLGFTVEAKPPSGLPATAGGYAGTEAVLLDDIPNGQLVPAKTAALATAVRTRGMGLLVLGGTHSLTAAWYAGTPLAAALPVAGTGAGPTDSTALELVLDRSGSMNDLAGDVTKISMAKAAALGAIAFAQAHHDKLGIVAFDTASHLVVPMMVMTAANAAAARRAVDGLTADGGTNIYGALRTAARQLTQRSGSAVAKQLILMTDGVSQSAFYDSLLRVLRASGATLSSVGLGGQVDKALLQHLATAGGGRYYYTNDAADLPRIFAAEERRGVRPAHVTGRIPAEVTASVPAVRGLVGANLPDVGGLDMTRLKPLATADITTGRLTTGGGGTASPRAPLLAQWQYGLGRVAVWTAGLAQAWAAKWSAKAGLWNDTVRWLLPGVPVQVLWPRLLDAYPGGAPAVAVDTVANAGVAPTAPFLAASVLPPRGKAVRITLAETATGRYAGMLPDAGPGVYRLAVSSPSSGLPAAIAELAVGYPREYLPSPLGNALLAQTAAATGGRVLTSPADAAAWESAHNGTHRLALWWPLALLAIIAFLAGAAGERMRRPPRAAWRSLRYFEGART